MNTLNPAWADQPFPVHKTYHFNDIGIVQYTTWETDSLESQTWSLIRWNHAY